MKIAGYARHREQEDARTQGFSEESFTSQWATLRENGKPYTKPHKVARR